MSLNTKQNVTLCNVTQYDGTKQNVTLCNVTQYNVTKQNDTVYCFVSLSTTAHSKMTLYSVTQYNKTKQNDNLCMLLSTKTQSKMTLSLCGVSQCTFIQYDTNQNDAVMSFGVMPLIAPTQTLRHSALHLFTSRKSP